jgi:tetraacyldisaccharide 4'-kinase
MASLLGGVPVMVGRHRLAAAEWGLRRYSPDVILLDDAFQHQRLERDLNLLLLDSEDPIGNGFLLPRGPLREPVSAVKRADAIIFTRSRRSGGRIEELDDAISAKPVFHSRHKTVLRFIRPASARKGLSETDLTHRYTARPETAIGGRRLFAFSALANNDAFFSAVADMDVKVLGTKAFPDHHFYTHEDIESVVDKALETGCDAVVTTDKDFVRLPQKLVLPVDLVVLGVEIDFGTDEARWQRFIMDRLGRSRMENPALRRGDKIE